MEHLKELEKKISLGKALHNLKNHEDFPFLWNEILDRIEENRDLLLNFRSGPASNEVAIGAHLYRYQAYQDLKNWFEDTIEEGIQAALDKARQSEKDPQEGNTSP